MEQILKIEETSFKDSDERYARCYDGYTVTTDKQVIQLGISNGQSCCENWGYFMTNDNIEEFIGSNILSVDVVDDCLMKEKVPAIYEGGVMYVNIETNKGTLQFTAYNEHNGYYGHTAVVKSIQLTEDQYF